jgi:hypothetical protein
MPSFGRSGGLRCASCASCHSCTCCAWRSMSKRRYSAARSATTVARQIAKRTIATRPLAGGEAIIRSNGIRVLIVHTPHRKVVAVRPAPKPADFSWTCADIDHSPFREHFTSRVAGPLILTCNCGPPSVTVTKCHPEAAGCLKALGHVNRTKTAVRVTGRGIGSFSTLLANTQFKNQLAFGVCYVTSPSRGLLRRRG